MKHETTPRNGRTLGLHLKPFVELLQHELAAQGAARGTSSSLDRHIG